MKAALALAEIELLATAGSDISELRLSQSSLVKDGVWRFERKAKPRSIGASKLRVDWERYEFHPALVEEMQRIFALYMKAPRMLGGRGAMKPNTFCDLVKTTLDFLATVTSLMPSPRLISSLSQFVMADLRKGGKGHVGVSHAVIRKGLRVLFHPSAARLLSGPAKLKALDMKNIEFAPSKAEAGEGSPYLTDELFGLLSEGSIARTQDFMRRMGMAVGDFPAASRFSASQEIEAICDFPSVFADYVAWRRGAKNLLNGDLNARYRLKRAGIRLGAMNDYLVEINDSAQVVVALYTGGRHSELASFEVDCIEDKDGVPCITGQVFKTSPDIGVFDDTWVAIPAVRDAVNALEALAELKNKRPLFSSVETASGHGMRGKGESYTGTGLVGMLQRHLKRVDTEGRFQSWVFNTHQFKHSLTRQMIKAKLGLPYVSYQLKHLHSRVSTLPSDVTLAYGNAAKLLQSQMAGFHLQEVKRGISRKLFDPDSLIVGGGAQDFNERRRAYFSGLMAAGLSKEQILDRLADSGSEVFVNVGLGYCSGKKRDKATGEQPPCIGSLRCNPVRCSNAVVTRDHSAGWRAIYVENRKRAEDPRFFYGKEEFAFAADEARSVLSSLGEEVAV